MAGRHDSILPIFTDRTSSSRRQVGHELSTTNGLDCIVALKALSEETRIRIVGLLSREALDVGEIAHRLGVSQYNVSKHLRILREADLLDVEKRGRQRLYALRPSVRRSVGSDRTVLDLGCCNFRFH
jgi:DNA-binding transcriptional ArsR family regulator